MSNILVSVLATLAVIMTLSDGCQSQSIQQLNVYDRQLAPCSFDPLTGWFRDGYARTDRFDRGLHTVCAEMTQEFLDYTKALGNDLSTPRGGFPGLVPGNRWALCAMRWRQAYDAGKAPKVYLEATNKKALTIVPLEELESLDSRALANP